MGLIYWIIGFTVITLLVWRVNKSNQKLKGENRNSGRAYSNSHTLRYAEAGADLERENYRLRHVLAELSVENHALKFKPPEYW